MTTDDEIAAAEAEVKRLADEHSAAQKRLSALLIRRSTELHGIEVGMLVRSRDRIYVVDQIRPESWSKARPWLYGRQLKKDGTPGNAPRTIYGEWEIVNPETTEQ